VSISIIAFSKITFLITSSISAHDNLLLFSIISFKFISPKASFTFIFSLAFFICISKICFLHILSGRSTFIVVEILHDLITAGSKSFIRFVVQIKSIFDKSSKPHISVKKVLTILVSSQELSFHHLFLNNASSSSKITITFFLVFPALYLNNLNNSFKLLAHSFI
jgi:hypothetical protein